MKRKKIAIFGAVTLVGLIVFFAWLLPILVIRTANNAIGEQTGRVSRIGSVGINPFTLTVTVRDFAIEERGQAPLVSIGRLRASLSPASLFRRALIVRELSLERPALSFARSAPNRYSFSDIVDRQRRLPKKKKEGSLLFSINNIALHQGSLDFFDAAVPGGRRHTIRDLEVGIPFISNIPYLEERYTSPKISALVNGTPFSFAGKLKPLSKSMETSVHLGLKRLSLPRYLAYAPVPPPVDLANGFFSLDAELNYRVSTKKQPELELSGTFRLDEVAVSLKNGHPLLRLAAAEVKATRLDPLAKRYEVASILLDRPELFASRDKNGAFMYATLLPAAKPAEPGEKVPQKASPAPPPELQVDAFRLVDGALHFNDSLPEKGSTTELSKIQGTLKNFRTKANSAAAFDLSLLLNGACRMASSGTFSVAPVKAKGMASVKDLDLKYLEPYLTPYLAKPARGRLEVATDFDFSGEKGLLTKNGSLSLEGFAVRYGTDEGTELSRIAVKEAAFSQKENRLTIGDVGVSKGSIILSREANGALSLLSLLKAPPAATRTGAPSTRIPKGQSARGGHPKEAPPFSYAVKKVHLDGLNLAFTDKIQEEHPRFTLNRTNLTLANINGPRFTPIALRFSSTFGKSSPLAADGVCLPAPFHYTGSISLGGIPLRDFEDYLPENLNVILVSGLLDAKLTVDLALKNGVPTGSFQGETGFHSFHILDGTDEEDLLKWETLNLDGLRGTLAPFSLGIREVALSNVYSRIIVRPDGTLNLQNLVEKPEAPSAPVSAPATAKAPQAPAPAPAKTQAPPAAPPSAAATAPKAINIETVVVQGGTLAFSDLHLSKPFNTTFYNLGGRVSGLSSEPGKFADVDLRGNLDNHSPLQVTGRINPLRDDLFVDLKVSFRGIELPTATPYSATYLGYTIDQGKLFLDLKYLIEKKQLTSENKVFIDQFTFGNKVESQKATTLPVRLAIALLKDKNGEIRLDLPVTGRTDDPKFSVWGVVWQMVKNLFVKAATSPFALISSVFGQGQDLSAVYFDPGSAKLPPTEIEKLKVIGKGLSERPGIRLEVEGFVNREKDAEGYRQELLKKKMKTEKFLLMVKKNREAAGMSADALQITPEERPQLLKAVYEREKFPKPRTMLGTLKPLPDDEMTKLILANLAVGDTQLRSLAHERCSSVIAFLTSAAKLPEERIFLKAGDIYAVSKKGDTRGRVEFGIGVK